MNTRSRRLPNPVLFTFIALALIASGAALADTRVLSDAKWRADIETVATTIRAIHPRPFRTIDPGEFDTAAAQLTADVPGLTDKEVIVRLAALVAMIDDGHTRLSIPREHPEIGLEFGHTPTPEPEHPSLRFKQLPIAFEQFDDGVFVVAADAAHSNLVGLELTAIDEMPIEDAMEAVRAITFAENGQLDRLMGADRLSLPEALVALGIARSADTLTLAFRAEGGATRTVDVNSLPAGPPEWAGPFNVRPVPLRLRHPDEKFWSRYVADGDFVYMQMDEIADGEISLAEFVVNTLTSATDKQARLVIDVRNNFGGSGGLNRTLVTSLVKSEALNQHDRTFVLIGRRTFSAAQMLVNELEQYTRVTFVGEPTGSRPDHYGDPKKIRLEHSGLTLRVSRLHWSSYTAFDDRESTNPDFVVKWTSKEFFAGHDPALASVSSLEDISLKVLLRDALARGDLQQVARHTLDSQRSAATFRDDFSGVLVELGAEFEASDQLDIASLTYQVGLYFYPEHGGLNSALERVTPAD